MHYHFVDIIVNNLYQCLTSWWFQSASSYTLLDVVNCSQNGICTFNTKHVCNDATNDCDQYILNRLFVQHVSGCLYLTFVFCTWITRVTQHAAVV